MKHDVEKKLRSLRPLAPSAELRQKCLSVSAVPSLRYGRQHWAWGLAACFLLTLVIVWNIAENERFSRLTSYDMVAQKPVNDLEQDIEMHLSKMAKSIRTYREKWGHRIPPPVGGGKKIISFRRGQF
jgi:hypothetical protein